MRRHIGMAAGLLALTFAGLSVAAGAQAAGPGAAQQRAARPQQPAPDAAAPQLPDTRFMLPPPSDVAPGARLKLFGYPVLTIPPQQFAQRRSVPQPNSRDDRRDDRRDAVAAPAQPMISCGTTIIPIDPDFDPRFTLSPPPLPGGMEFPMRIVPRTICRPEDAVPLRK